MPDPSSEEMYRDAKELMGNKAFQHAIMFLRKQWFQEMLAEPPTGSAYPLTCALACARIRALEAIPTELQLIINHYKEDMKRNG